METTPESKSVFASKQVHGALILVLVLLAAYLFAQTLNAFKEYRYIGAASAGSHAITVSGEGEVFTQPDTALFTFSVMQDADTPGAVRDMVNSKVDEVLKAVRERGVEEKDVRTLSYELTPKYEFEQARCINQWQCPPGRQVQKGFTLTHTVEVKVRDLNKASEVVGVVSEKWATNVSQLSFMLDDEEAKRAEARALAIEDAREKAESIAEDLGVGIVRVVSFNDDSGANPFMSARALGFGDAAMTEEKAASAVSLPTGENRITSNVTVTYEIR